MPHAIIPFRFRRQDRIRSIRSIIFKRRGPMSEATPLLHASSGSPGAPPAQARRRSKAKRALKTEDPAEPRRRGHGGGNNPHESDDDDNDDDDDDELSDRDGGSESEESPLRRSFRYLKPALENAPRVIHPLGEATRKPRWTGIRSKVTAVGPNVPMRRQSPIQSVLTPVLLYGVLSGRGKQVQRAAAGADARQRAARPLPLVRLRRAARHDGGAFQAADGRADRPRGRVLHERPDRALQAAQVARQARARDAGRRQTAPAAGLRLGEQNVHGRAALELQAAVERQPEPRQDAAARAEACLLLRVRH